MASFDSASAMVQALGRFLRGQDFPRVGASALATPPAPIINALPRRVREAGFTWSGWREALPPDEAGRVRSEEIARWITSAYPRRPYPAVVIGSASGSVIHLCAALGIPWLPQTTLLLARRSGVDIDKPRAILNRAFTSRSFLGTDTGAYPWDFAAYLRYSRAVQQLPNRVPMPSPLSLEHLDAFLAEIQERATVRWIDGDGIDAMRAGSVE